ncbi:MAG: FKBP-type peptidyl-prolyl cis-trans isomerase [Bacteroidales bacterium]|nr:FKBP-type peptidyl-prolyl cis-trans isomerase [Bacteroidales bacterium]
MKIEKNKVVILTYTALSDGQTVDHAPENRPLDYIQGFHMLLPKFEEELEGKEEGDAFAFEVTPAEAYGEYDPAHRFDIPKDSFTVDGKLREDLLVEGRIIPMLNGAGEVCMARIVEIKDRDVTVDFNHPMAGKALAFSGKVLSVRDATEQELREGLHGEFLPPEEQHHCRRHGKGGCCHHRDEGPEGEGCCHHEGHGADGEGCCHPGEGCCPHHEND